MIERIDALRAEGERALSGAATSADLEAVRVRFLGRKSELTQILRGLKDLEPDARARAGARANEARGRLEALLAEAEARVQARSAPDASRDVTLPGRRPPVGHRHIIQSVIQEIEEIFRGLGFSVAEGPDVEDERHNFGALNMPKGHPARAETDTFYLRPDVLLRTHTSSVQIRVMEKTQPPVRIICPGRAYRNEAVDATHFVEFHQIEGLYVDEGVSMADLKGTLDRFFKEFFGPKTEIRFAPSFYPFVEPGAVVDVRCLFCAGKGCSVCGPLSGGWLEVLGAGMVHPNVFRAVGYDPSRWTGFAFGGGIERLVMLRHGVPDVRLFYENDIRFLREF
ncbi:MAG: phenylalanine--tRNA ligase subunit alpha [Candidatus Eisenbacteria bacterium]|uniref:Phenylalanine--tRNA ligase alpha subunit n=1 Tax=Eiseniibacteriota bacterium TaxID=2212470 RepID=A0A538TKR8_UNCEI|nr:MAG: phenylalanine--tRNA ligase subunit alpha [Candidatus Eisenbacteria bacterium]